MDFFTTATLSAAAAVLVVEQILKFKVVPTAFANRYPVPTNIILSIIASLVVDHQVWSHNIAQALLHVLAIAVVAAITYNQLLARWTELRAMEG